MCEREGRITVATVVDHIQAHKGDPLLMWDWNNWQPLCAPHHNSDKQAIEKGGTAKGKAGVDLTGRPRDRQHPWNRPRGM